MGPLVSREQQERVLGYIDAGKREGASVVVGGDAPAHPRLLREADGARRT